MKEAGLTLVELMMVLFIMGLMTSAVVLTLPSAPSKLDQDLDLLTAHLNQTAQRSIIMATPTAFGLSTQGYAFFIYRGDEWILDRNVSWQTDVDVELKKSEWKIELNEIVEPQIVFEPNGLTAPFELSFRGDDAVYTISSSGFENITKTGP